jgi:hypothetical protein
LHASHPMLEENWPCNALEVIGILHPTKAGPGKLYGRSSLAMWQSVLQSTRISNCIPACDAKSKLSHERDLVLVQLDGKWSWQ